MLEKKLGMIQEKICNLKQSKQHGKDENVGKEAEKLFSMTGKYFARNTNILNTNFHYYYQCREFEERGLVEDQVHGYPPRTWVSSPA